MNYAVSWWPLAEAQLTDIWDRAPDPDAVADAADDVNRALGTNPTGLGESRGSPARRLWFQRPLCVLFVVDNANRTVYVAAVRWVGL
jgi:hypothetical protein